MTAADSRAPAPAWPAWPQFDAATERALVGALRAGRWSVSAPSAGSPSLERRFATAFAAYNASPYAVSVDHGSSALVVALEALGVGPGDEVLVPAMTWVASASSVLRCGALPVLLDVDPRSGCIDAATVAAEASARTAAVIVVHLACTSAGVEELLAVTDRLGIALVEDCAQCHGARWNGRSLGTFGAVGAFSFQARKVLTAGEG
ncbi:MAG: L-glutamine:scyllo-inosose aminotransferase, partial [Solirubrobacteraceae bacterium]|nr:L-glutamine:scyllo-inosose aminotransferase [Solirubrobacteraceae bacterium]